MTNVDEINEEIPDLDEVDMYEDLDEDGDEDVEWYPIPEDLQAAWDENLAAETAGDAEDDAAEGTGAASAENAPAKNGPTDGQNA